MEIDTSSAHAVLEATAASMIAWAREEQGAETETEIAAQLGSLMGSALTHILEKVDEVTTLTPDDLVALGGASLAALAVAGIEMKDAESDVRN